MNTPYILGDTYRKLHHTVDTYAQQHWQAGHYFATEYFFFLLKSVLACSFALSLFMVLALSKKLSLGFIPRYDFILLMALGIQIWLVLTKQEHLYELKAICWFHLLGLLLEIFKSHPSIGSWAYPEFAYSKVFGAPLYCGFMYASVASFMMQFWRRTNMQLLNYQYPKLAMLLAALVYINFFTHHFIGDYRWILTALLFCCFWQSSVVFSCYKKQIRLPLIGCFALLGAVVWLGENIATFYGAWQYPNQIARWNWVHFGKVGSWSLMVVITFVIIVHFVQKHEFKNQSL